MKLSERLVLPSGFKAAGIAAGIKKSGKKDLAVIYSDLPAIMAGTFTTNQVTAAPVKLCRAHLAQCGIGRAIVVNSGVANACTGPRGLRDANRMAEIAARALGVNPLEVYVCSTGRIGVLLPMELVEKGIRRAIAALKPQAGEDAAHAIMTTDTRPKFCSATLTVERRLVRIAGFAKGAGMIEPKMATMLAFLLTDAAVEKKAFQAALRDAVENSFNRITVDGDRSTNDTVLAMANGAADLMRPLAPEHPDWAEFVEALQAVTLNLAQKIVRDGEGATKFVTVRVHGARNNEEADIAARSVANSLLVKTSWVGDYPNWGRIMDALGYSAAKVDENRVDISYNGKPAARRGQPAGTPVEELRKILRQKEFTIDIHLHLGKGEATVFTCNCTEEYVRINAD